MACTRVEGAALPAVAWLALCLGIGIGLGVQQRDLCAGFAGIAAIAMQAGWSFGFFAGLKEGLSDPAEVE